MFGIVLDGVYISNFWSKRKVTTDQMCTHPKNKKKERCKVFFLG